MTTNSASRTAALAAILTATLGTMRAGAAEDPRADAVATSRRIVVSIPDRKLALVEDDAVTLFEVAVGKPSTPSPVGTFTIVTRVENPTYYKPGKVVGPGSTNPVGTWTVIMCYETPNNTKGRGVTHHIDVAIYSVV